MIGLSGESNRTANDMVSFANLSTVVNLSDMYPTMIESESSRLFNRIVNTHDTTFFVVARVLDDVQPISIAMLTGTLKLRMRHPDWVIIEAARHGFYLDPANGLATFCRFEQVEAGIVGGRACSSGSSPMMRSIAFSSNFMRVSWDSPSGSDSSASD